MATSKGTEPVPFRAATREDILARRGQLGTTYVDVPEWELRVKLRALSAAERDAFEAGNMVVHGATLAPSLSALTTVRARLVAASCVNEDGTPMFTAEDVESIGEMDSAPVQRLFDAAAKLSRLSGKDIEELAGNSNGAQPVSSPTN